ncbi:MAG: asparagine synthase (glutamine-hydrolyzing) [Desulfatibacillaceae bacterium]
MCGICGVLHRNFETPADPVVIHAMTTAMAHRGPDGEGVYTDGPLGLGARRLAIIDVASGRQPLANEDGTVTVVFNGEIYNHAEIREELRGQGHVLHTRCDTEVLPHLWEDSGPDMVQRLNGMFAFALWDSSSRTLFIARDRLGEKPLYYYAGPDRLVFASEIRTLFAAGNVPAELDPQAVHDALTLRFVPSPATGFRHIQKLPAGHWLMVSPGKLRQQRYWDVEEFTPHAGNSLEENAKELAAMLDEMVGMRLESEAPLGAMLSGGLDSSAVVACMRRAGHDPVCTYNVDYAEPGPHSESAYAKEVAEAFSTEHHQITMSLDDFVSGLSDTVRSLEEPLADMAAWPILSLCRQSRSSATVLLAGTGGDELFGGYGVYAEAAYHKLARHVPDFLWKTLVSPVYALSPFKLPGRNFVKRIRQPVETTFLGGSTVYGGLDEEGKTALYTRDFLGSAELAPTVRLCRRAMSRAEDATRLGKMSYLDTVMWLADSHLTMMDKMSMAASMEMRNPLLDHRLVEWAARLPDSHKRTMTRSKIVFRQAMQGTLPESVLTRKKRGFSTPVDIWFSKPHSEMEDMLFDPGAKTRHLFRPEAIRDLFRRHRQKDGDHSATLFTLLVMELWMREFL